MAEGDYRLHVPSVHALLSRVSVFLSYFLGVRVIVSLLLCGVPSLDRLYKYD